MRLPLARCAFAVLAIAALSASACRSCNDVGCFQGVRFEVRGAQLERGRNEFEARVCLDDYCKEGTARMTRRGVGTIGNADIEISPGPDNIMVTLRLPFDEEYDSRTERTATLELVVNGQSPINVHESIVLSPNAGFGGCSSCWGAVVEAHA